MIALGSIRIDEHEGSSIQIVPVVVLNMLPGLTTGPAIDDIPIAGQAAIEILLHDLLSRDPVPNEKDKKEKKRVLGPEHDLFNLGT